MNFSEALHHFRATYLTGNILGVDVYDLTKFTGMLVAGLILGRLLRYPVARIIERFTPKDDHTTSQKVSSRFEKLSFLLVFAIVLNMGAIDVLHLPGWLWMRMSSGTVIFLAVIVTIIALEMIDIALLGLKKRWSDQNSQVDELLINFIRKGVRIFIVLIAILVTAQQMGINVTSVVTGLGIGGAAIALGAQGLIANIIGTVEIVADRLYHVGDRIHFDYFDGFVTDVGLRSTKIRALTGEQIIVPNKKMAENQIRNYSRNGLVRTNVSVGLTYSTDHDEILKAMKILDGIFKARKDVDTHHIYLKSLGDYSLQLEVIFWARYSVSAEYNELMGQIHLLVKKEFDAAGIEFAFPTQTLHVTQSPPSGSLIKTGA